MALQTSFLNKIERRFENLGGSLCIGLDPDPELMPDQFPPNAKGVFRFLKIIIEATQDLATAYKPNLAFFESLGSDGPVLLEKILSLVPAEVAVILDATRGDIGSSSAQ